jgi:hypothetical protein
MFGLQRGVMIIIILIGGLPCAALVLIKYISLLAITVLFISTSR